MLRQTRFAAVLCAKTGGGRHSSFKLRSCRPERLPETTSTSTPAIESHGTFTRRFGGLMNTDWGGCAVMRKVSQSSVLVSSMSTLNGPDVIAGRTVSGDTAPFGTRPEYLQVPPQP